MANEVVFGRQASAWPTTNNPVAPSGPVFPTAPACAPLQMPGEVDDGLIRPKSLTAAERADLAKGGWQEGDAVPRDLAKRTETSVADSLRLELASVKAAEAAAQREKAAMPEQAAPGVAEALQQIQTGSLPKIQLDEPAKVTETAAAEQPDQCPHCGWDRRLKDDVAITADDKIEYLAATVLGGKLFQKTFSRLGGALLVTVRDLTIAESDLCHKQCFFERERGDIKSAMDYFEQMARYRGILQLARVVTHDTIFRFPDNIEGWGLVPTDDNNTVLTQIYAQVTGRLIVGESMHRILMATVQEFNRLTRKLEDNAQNPDF